MAVPASQTLARSAHERAIGWPGQPMAGPSDGRAILRPVQPIAGPSDARAMLWPVQPVAGEAHGRTSQVMDGPASPCPVQLADGWTSQPAQQDQATDGPDQGRGSPWLAIHGRVSEPMTGAALP
jgi:hypothetical protein